MINKKYKGVVVPAVTPLTSEYRLDVGAVEKMLSNFSSHHVTPFILGTTGEAASLPYSVKYDYLQAAAKVKSNNEMLYAGISSNCLEESVEFAHQCFEAGADVVVATVPCYYPLSADQMKTYFEGLANSIPGPLMIYNIPATTHISVPLEVIEVVSHHPNIVGLKDSERNEERLKTALELWSGRSDFSYFAGWAAQSANTLLNGGDGIIPSTGNFIPGLYDQLYIAAQQNNRDKAFELQRQSDMLGNLYQANRLLGESLWALKVLMKNVGLCNTYMMPPLQMLSEEEEQKIIKSCKKLL